MNRYLVVTLIAVVAIFLSRGQKFVTLSPDAVTEERLANIFDNTTGKVLLYFWQPKCAPCELMDPMVDQVISEYPKNLTLVKIDTSNPDNKAVHDAYGINAIPTFVVVQKGKIVSQWVGPFKDKALFITFLHPSTTY